jgi:hypothetical protein
MAFAVSAMIGRLERASGSARMRRVASKPSMPGM